MSTEENELTDLNIRRIYDPQEFEQEGLTEDELDDESEESYEEGVLSGIEAASVQIGSIKENAVIQKIEDTRSRLAIMYVGATFLIFFIGIIIAIVDAIRLNASIVTNLMDIIPLLSGIFLGSLGFVIGYYFKKQNDV